MSNVWIAVFVVFRHCHAKPLSLLSPVGVKENKREEICIAFSTVNPREFQNCFLILIVFFSTAIVNYTDKKIKKHASCFFFFLFSDIVSAEMKADFAMLKYVLLSVVSERLLQCSLSHGTQLEELRYTIELQHY